MFLLPTVYLLYCITKQKKNDLHLDQYVSSAAVIWRTLTPQMVTFASLTLPLGSFTEFLTPAEDMLSNWEPFDPVLDTKLRQGRPVLADPAQCAYYINDLSARE